MKFEVMLDIVFMLLARKKVTAGQIAEKHGISKRSVYRYIEEISVVAPIYVIHGAQGGYSFTDDFRLPSAYFTDAEYKVALQALCAFKDELPCKEINSVIDKLTATCKAATRVDLNSSTLIIDSGPWGVTANYNNKLRVLEECVESSKAVKIFYRNASGVARERVIEPHTLVLKQGIWYVYAFCRLKGEFRIFKVGRIESEVVLDEVFERRSIDGLDDALSIFAAEDAEEVVFEVAEEVSSEIEEWLGVECVDRSGQKIIARAALPVNRGLTSKILGYGGKVKVLAPKSLKDMLKTAAKEIAELYA